MERFEINHAQRLSPSKIFCSAPLRMLSKPSFDISRDPGIEGVVRAKDYVDLPILGHQFDSGEAGCLSQRGKANPTERPRCPNRKACSRQAFLLSIAMPD